MITIENLTRMVSATLKTLHIFSNNCKEINVKDVYLLNEDTLCCDFYPVSRNSYDIKLEIAPIMGCFNGIFRDKNYKNVNLLNYAVRAFDENNNEILYALSTKTTAELIGKGGSIEWLASTFFQINTQDFRLAQAKQIISEIENGLREIVKIKLRDQFGDDWWEKALNSKTGRDVKKIYFNNFGEDCTDGDILIAYTFTLQLKEIIISCYNLFTKYFQSSAEFETLMDSLNKLRREEAHNRPISNLDLKNLQTLHEELLSGVLQDLKSLQSVYLTENWRGKIKKIMPEKRYKDVYTDLEISNEIDAEQKMFKIRENKSSLISYLDDTILKLKSVIVPIHKKSTHTELLSCFEVYRVLQNSLFDEYSTLHNERIDIVKDKIKIHDRKMNEFVEKFLLNEK
ncbi:Swt1 family HEPN domain-containing protein [Chryseobacterium tructae]|uniref:Swt1 family HEPN domain-containing protein n=1 Tax=Chryseobacterium tructae TaxID=1037380 RepID=A0ABV7Y056_9FLAO|nr:Swt1 family HEPN domain-containing protein [Chryseobacterium tructae]MDN3694320.1 Swt1 family HEPN domain-containing protein [Chryseobacterium tructae]